MLVLAFGKQVTCLAKIILFLKNQSLLTLPQPFSLGDIVLTQYIDSEVFSLCCISQSSVVLSSLKFKVIGLILLYDILLSSIP